MRKRSPEGAADVQPSAKREVRLALTGSEETVEAVGSSSSAPIVSGGAVAAERSPPICEGELCRVSSPSVRLGIGLFYTELSHVGYVCVAPVWLPRRPNLYLRILLSFSAQLRSNKTCYHYEPTAMLFLGIFKM